MLSRVIRWSIHHRRAVCLLWLAILVAGLLAAARLPLDAFPDTTPVQVQINTPAPGLAPLEVERQITFPIEQALGGLAGLTEVRSTSRFGLSQVVAVFADGTEIYRARQMVAESLAGVEVAAGAARPALGPVATGLGEIFHYLVTGETKSLAELRTVHDWIVRPQLRPVPGVAEINAWGGDERQIHVVVDPLDLARYQITLDHLVGALAGDNANVGGGTLDQSGQSSLIQGIGLITSREAVENVLVATRDGVPIRVCDVARVVEGREIRAGAVTADGRGEAVLGLGFMLMGENSRDVTRRLAARLAEVRKSLPAGVTVEPVHTRTDLVDHVLHTVAENLAEGALLVVAVLFAFLGRLRAGLLVALAIPCSMLFAANLMLRAGIAGSLMSLGAIDFGLLVDSSVIQVENAVRRLAEDRSSRSREEIVADAVVEVRRPTMFGELIIMIVYLPILALTGVEGKLFRPLAATVIFALIGSLLLSLTLVPALAAAYLPRRGVAGEGRLVAWLKRLYLPALGRALARPRAVVAASALLVAGAALLALRLGSEFVPRLSEGTIVVNTVRLAGVSVEESVRYGTQIERLVLAGFPDEVERVWTRTGTAEVATDPMGLEVSDLFIALKHRSAWRRARTQGELTDQLAAAIGALPGMRAVFTQPIEMRMNEITAGIRADLGVKLYGDDFTVLARKAREIEALVRAVPGAADVASEQLTGQPVLAIEIDRQAIARHGIAAREVLDVIAALGGREVGLLHEGERRFPIAVRLDDRSRLDADAIRRILVVGAGGDRVPLGLLARVEPVTGPATIQRDWAKRRIVVQANVRGRDVGSFVHDVKQALDREVELPPGYYVRFGGQFEHLERAERRLLVVVPLALGLIFLLLYLTYGRVLDAARVFTGVPFAAVGGIIALWLRGMPFSISAAVGFIALSGVAVLGDMVLVSTIRQRLRAGLALGAAIESAASERLRPVVMTALVASLGFVPMAVNTGIGAEVQRPLATVVIGGVLSSTLLTLFVLPALYAVFGAGRAAAGGDRAAAGAPPALPGAGVRS